MALILCLVSCDHAPRRSWPLFRAKALLAELIAGSGKQSGTMATSPENVEAWSHAFIRKPAPPQKFARKSRTPDYRIAKPRRSSTSRGRPRPSPAKWLKRDDEHDRSHRAHTLHTTLTAPQEAVVLSLRQTLYLPRDDVLFITRQYINPEVSRSGIARLLKREGVSKLADVIPKFFVSCATNCGASSNRGRR